MYHWRVFLWENGHKSTEYTKYVVAPIFIEDKLDETLDSGEVILKAMPIATRNDFPPKTKFRLERYMTEDYTDEPRKWDLVVEHDDVEEYEGCPEICTHRISLIEASVIAQGMHVDNIALTYELQDVDLNYKTVVEMSDTIESRGALEINNNGYGYTQNNKFGTPIHKNESIKVNERFYFENSYFYKWKNYENLAKISYIQDARINHEIEIQIPELWAQGCFTTGEWEDLCEVWISVYVIEKLCDKNGTVLSTIQIASKQIQNDLSVRFNDNRDGVYRAVPYPANDGSTEFGAFPIQIEEYNKSGAGLVWKTFSELYTTSTSYEITQQGINTTDRTIKFETKVLSDVDLEAEKYYEYEINCRAYGRDNVKRYPTHYSCYSTCWQTNTGTYIMAHQLTTETANETIQPSSISLLATFRVGDTAISIDRGKFLAHAEKYKCYDLVRKAMLTCDTQIFDNNTIGLDTIQYPITLDEYNGDEEISTKEKLQGHSVYETIFEQKNLWEVLLQSGYYLHSIPRLDFATDGTDRFALKYRQLGNTKKKADTSNKITVFNSRNLSEFFTQYDSYVTNLFSPQNEVEEWGVVKTSDKSYLVSNDTAEIILKYPIQEITDFKLSYNGSEFKSALDMTFEESVYSILTPIIGVVPSKARALYYRLGDNKLLGLNYTPPSINNDTPYAMKNILSALFGTNPKSEIKFNDISYYIKYRTQDSLRISQVRPDLQNFMKNSAYEKYPHHEQYFGQQDKIIDSERFSANLFGKLIRVGNAVYQRQEYADSGSEKESGDLVEINGEPYYVTATENEYYADAILQKVTYSKNFNQLANIVTIPSEPRFYEVSERSQVRREIRLMDFLLLTTKENATVASPMFINNNKWREIAKSLLFADGSFTLPNFAYTRFSADKIRHPDGDEWKSLFPSSDIEQIKDNSLSIPENRSYSEVIVPLLHFPLKNAIVFEWDMDDNFKAGDSVNASISGKGSEANLRNDAYYSLQSVRYCDIFGRADLLNFKLFYKNDWTMREIQRLPFVENGVVPTEDTSTFYIPDSLSIGLDKDNREALSFNYQINLLQEDSTFITYSNLFGQKSSRLKMCFLNTEASLYDDGVPITIRTIVADKVTYLLDNTSRNAIEIRIMRPANIDASAVKSIVLYEEDGASKYAYIAKNVSGIANEDKFNSWYLYPIFAQ